LSFEALLIRLVGCSSVYLAAILIPLFWSGFFAYSFVERKHAVDGARMQTSNVVHVFQENTDRIFHGVDRSLLTLRTLYKQDPRHFDLIRMVKNAGLDSDMIAQFALIGPDGYMIASTSGYAGPPLYLGDRAHFTGVANAQNDVFYISL